MGDKIGGYGLNHFIFLYKILKIKKLKTDKIKIVHGDIDFFFVIQKIKLYCD
jgi:hypothetical protein